MISIPKYILKRNRVYDIFFGMRHDDLGHLVPILMLMSPWNHEKKKEKKKKPLSLLIFLKKNLHKVNFQMNNVFLA